jgi:hypothetical protein
MVSGSCDQHFISVVRYTGNADSANGSDRADDPGSIHLASVTIASSNADNDISC